LILDLVQTLAFGGVVLFLGYGIKRILKPLARYNIPAPVVGGMLVSVLMLTARAFGWIPVTFDTTLQTPLMIAFFTSIGFAASLSLLRVGGPMVLAFLVLSTVVAVAQNVIGIGLALLVGRHPLMGVLAGSVTLTGGPATGLAFAPAFEPHVPGAATVAVAAAMVGIVSGGVIGGPLGTLIIERYRLAAQGGGTGNRAPGPGVDPVAAHVVEEMLPEPTAQAPAGEDVEAYGLLKTLVIMLVAMWTGGWISRGFAALGATLPAYIGAMIAAAVIRNLDDATGWFGLSQKLIDDLGSVALSLFLVLALMTLELWKLAGLALPLAIILVGQIVLVAIAAVVVFLTMGRDFDAAVMSAGFIGFMLGTTANAMANMDALVQKFKPAPKAFLVVPMVGAFFIDFVNALIITAFLNLYR
jgi:glutamate:Na+ symporter, ESS family